LVFGQPNNNNKSSAQNKAKDNLEVTPEIYNEFLRQVYLKYDTSTSRQREETHPVWFALYLISLWRTIQVFDDSVEGIVGLVRIAKLNG
jgi:hypothetical protein